MSEWHSVCLRRAQDPYPVIYAPHHSGLMLGATGLSKEPHSGADNGAVEERPLPQVT